MNKKQLLDSIKSEMLTEENERKSLRDKAFFEALAKNKNLTKSEFLKTYKEPAKSGLALNQRYIKKLVETSGFKSKAPSKFSEKLNINAEYKKIYETLARYCEKFPTGKNLVIHGAAGTGKTYAVHIIANNLIEKGFSVLYLTAFSLLERFKKYVQTYGDETETDALFDCDLLIIDDLGTEPVIRNISEEYLYNVINERYSENKAFIVTTNLKPEQLYERYEQRIASRILSKETSVVIEMKSKDLRLAKV